MTDKPTRRELMRPAQLLGLAFAAALFAGVVTLVAMGFFQSAGGADKMQRALVTALVVLGITFIVVLVSLALLLLTVNPADVEKTIDRPVLLPPEEDAAPEEPPTARPADPTP